MARVTIAEVKAVIETGLTDTEINAAINAADIMVETRLGRFNLLASLLKEIERYLAAHFVAVREPRERSISADGVSVSYETVNTGSKSGDGLVATIWGQQAIALDPTGTLNAVGDKLLRRPMLRAL